MPPLYRIDLGKEIYYALDEAERDGILDRLVAEKKRGKPQVTRFKGLGEMNPPQLRETTMDPNTRRLVQLTLDDVAATSEMMDMLLAKKRAGDRKTWLESKGNLAEVWFDSVWLCLGWCVAAGADWARAEARAEHPVDGMRGGNLSGLANVRRAVGGFRPRRRPIYRSTSRTTWRPKPCLHVPPVPESGLPWG
jgi:hypothetical protein